MSKRTFSTKDLAQDPSRPAGFIYKQTETRTWKHETYMHLRAKIKADAPSPCYIETTTQKLIKTYESIRVCKFQAIRKAIASRFMIGVGGILVVAGFAMVVVGLTFLFPPAGAALTAVAVSKAALLVTVGGGLAVGGGMVLQKNIDAKDNPWRVGPPLGCDPWENWKLVKTDNVNGPFDRRREIDCGRIYTQPFLGIDPPTEHEGTDVDSADEPEIEVLEEG